MTRLITLEEEIEKIRTEWELVSDEVIAVEEELEELYDREVKLYQKVADMRRQLKSEKNKNNARTEDTEGSTE